MARRKRRANDGKIMGRAVTDQQTNRRDGVRRTLWITGSIAVGLFLLSILSMLRIG